MITEAQVEAYRRDGFIVVENLMTSADASAMRQVIAEFVAGAAAVETHTVVYDLEPGHTPAAHKVRRIRAAKSVNSKPTGS